MEFFQQIFVVMWLSCVFVCRSNKRSCGRTPGFRFFIENFRFIKVRKIKSIFKKEFFESNVRTLSIDSQVVWHPITLSNIIGYSHLLLQNYLRKFIYCIEM